jgi:prepilin-type processing-associated H-X9-DG protein
MAALGAQSIASSYEQLLHVDADGGGNSTTLVSVKDGDNGTTFALQLASDNIKVSGSSDLDGAVTINESSADVDFRVESNGDANMLFVDGGNDKVGISTNAPSAKIHIDNDTDQFAMFVDSDYRENTRFHSTESNQGTRVVITNGSITSDAGFGFNVGNGGDNKIEIGTATSAGSITSLMTIDSGGDVDIETGDIFFSSAGKGICLGVTSNTDSNTLDDYEEGTWTMALTCSGSGTITINTSNDTGHYTKIGRMVHCVGYFNVSAISSPVGRLNISLPFTPATLTEGGTAFASMGLHGLVSNNAVDTIGEIGEGAAFIDVYMADSNDFASDSAQQINTGTDGRLSVSYLA